MGIINTFRSSKWRLTFSNIPSIYDMEDMKHYELYVKSLMFPGYSVDEMVSDFKNQRIRYPVSKINDNLQPISIGFKGSEELENYYSLFEFIQQMKYGENVTPEFIRNNTVKSIAIIIMDNEKRDIYKYSFENCFLQSLSSLDLVQGIDEEVTFMTTWIYENIQKIKLQENN
jgi:hypothetical protein